MILARETTGASSLALNSSSSKRSPPGSRHLQQKISLSCLHASNRHDQRQLPSKNRHFLHQLPCNTRHCRPYQPRRLRSPCSRSFRPMPRSQFQTTLVQKMLEIRQPTMICLLSRPSILHYLPTCTLLRLCQGTSKHEAVLRLPCLETQRPRYLDPINGNLPQWTTVVTSRHWNPP